MPQTFHFRSGSVIYFKGDPADKVYLLQRGMIKLVYQDVETGKDVHDMVQKGEFFGVKSALGRYAREENVVVLKNATVMAFSIPEFEKFASENTRIVMKMLTVFSNQLRRVHRQVATLLKNAEQNPDAGLFSMGEYYFKQKRFDYAQHVFSRYLTYYPSGKNVEVATKALDLAERAIAAGYATGQAAPASVKTKAKPRADAPAPAKADPSKAYYDALNLVKQEKYQQAYLAFKQIEDTNEGSEWAAKSSFEIGRCFFILSKFDECIQYYTSMLSKYPRHPALREVVFFIGQSNERLGKKEQAVAFYKKVLSIPAPDADGVTTKTRRALEGLE
jgi:CRP-like cAMP-binding protein